MGTGPITCGILRKALLALLLLVAFVVHCRSYEGGGVLTETAQGTPALHTPDVTATTSDPETPAETPIVTDAANSTIDAPVRLVAETSDIRNTSPAAAVIVAKFTMHTDISQIPADISTASVLGVNALDVGDVVLVKGGRGLYTDHSAEAGRWAALQTHVDQSNRTAVARSLARCYAVIDIEGECDPETAAVLRFLRTSTVTSGSYATSYTPIAEAAACPNGDCKACVSRTPCPLQIEFGFQHIDVQPYGEGAFAYSSGYPVLTPLDEGKSDPAVWTKGSWRAFYGSTHNYAYDYTNRKFKDPDHEVSLGGTSLWSMSWLCPWGGATGGGFSCNRGASWGSGNQRRVNALEQKDDLCMYCNKVRDLPGDYPVSSYMITGPCEDQVGAEKVCSDGARYGTIDCNDRSKGGWGDRCKKSCGHCEGAKRSCRTGYTGHRTKKSTPGTGWDNGRDPSGRPVSDGPSIICVPNTVDEPLDERRFESAPWSVWSEDWRESGDERCARHGATFGDGWQQVFASQNNNEGGGYYPKALRGLARGSLRMEETLSVCSAHKEVTNQLLSHKTQAAEGKAPVFEVTDALAGSWDYMRQNPGKSQLTVVDGDGNILRKTRWPQDVRRFPYSASTVGPVTMSPELTWEPSPSRQRKDVVGLDGSRSCNQVCESKGKFCFDAHELDDVHLSSFVHGSETLQSVAKYTRRLRCDEYGNNPNRDWAPPAITSGIHCLCGRLVARGQTIGRIRWDVPNAAEQETSCNEVCARNGGRCVDLDEVPHDHEVRLGLDESVATAFGEHLPGVCKSPNGDQWSVLQCAKMNKATCESFANAVLDGPCEDQVGAEKSCADGARNGTIDCGDRSKGGWGDRCRKSCGHCPPTKNPCNDQVGAEQTCYDGARNGTIDCNDRSTGGWGDRCKKSCGHCDRHDCQWTKHLQQSAEGLFGLLSVKDAAKDAKADADLSRANAITASSVADTLRLSRSLRRCSSDRPMVRSQEGLHQCVCTTGQADPSPTAEGALSSVRSGGNQWFHSGQRGVQYRDRSSGSCYELGTDCVGTAASCITGKRTTAVSVSCTPSYSHRLNTGEDHPRSHVFAQDPDAVVSHSFWSDVTVARTVDHPDHESVASGPYKGGLGGGCGATYKFEHADQVYVSASHSVGSLSVGQRAIDTRPRFRCNYKYTSRGALSKIDQSKLLGSDRGWKAWWGATRWIPIAEKCYDEMSYGPASTRFGEHAWAVTDKISADGKQRRCKMYVDATAAISEKDGKILKSENLHVDEGRQLPKLAARSGRKLELVLRNEATYVEKTLQWSGKPTKSCMEACHGDTAMDAERGRSIGGSRKSQVSTGTCALVYDANGRLAHPDVDLGCSLVAGGASAATDEFDAPVPMWRAFYGDEGLPSDLGSWPASGGRQQHADAHCIAQANHSRAAAFALPPRLRGAAVLTKDHPASTVVYCRRYREVTNWIVKASVPPNLNQFDMSALEKWWFGTTQDRITSASTNEVSSRRLVVMNDLLGGHPGGSRTSVGMYPMYGKKTENLLGTWMSVGGVAGQASAEGLFGIFSKNSIKNTIEGTDLTAGANLAADKESAKTDRRTCTGFCLAKGPQYSCVDYGDTDEGSLVAVGGRALVMKKVGTQQCHEVKQKNGTRDTANECLCRGPANEDPTVRAVYEAGDYILSKTHWPFALLRPEVDTPSVSNLEQFGTNRQGNEEAMFPRDDKTGEVQWPIERVLHFSVLGTAPGISTASPATITGFLDVVTPVVSTASPTVITELEPTESDAANTAAADAAESGAAETDSASSTSAEKEEEVFTFLPGRLYRSKANGITYIALKELRRPDIYHDEEGGMALVKPQPSPTGKYVTITEAKQIPNSDRFHYKDGHLYRSSANRRIYFAAHGSDFFRPDVYNANATGGNDSATMRVLPSPIGTSKNVYLTTATSYTAEKAKEEAEKAKEEAEKAKETEVYTFLPGRLYRSKTNDKVYLFMGGETKRHDITDGGGVALVYDGDTFGAPTNEKQEVAVAASPRRGQYDFMWHTGRLYADNKGAVHLALKTWSGAYGFWEEENNHRKVHQSLTRGERYVQIATAISDTAKKAEEEAAEKVRMDAEAAEKAAAKAKADEWARLNTLHTRQDGTTKVTGVPSAGLVVFVGGKTYRSGLDQAAYAVVRDFTAADVSEAPHGAAVLGGFFYFESGKTYASQDGRAYTVTQSFDAEDVGDAPGGYARKRFDESLDITPNEAIPGTDRYLFKPGRYYRSYTNDKVYYALKLAHRHDVYNHNAPDGDDTATRLIDPLPAYVDAPYRPHNNNSGTFMFASGSTYRSRTNGKLYKVREADIGNGQMVRVSHVVSDASDLVLGVMADLVPDGHPFVAGKTYRSALDQKAYSALHDFVAGDVRDGPEGSAAPGGFLYFERDKTYSSADGHAYTVTQSFDSKDVGKAPDGYTRKRFNQALDIAPYEQPSDYFRIHNYFNFRGGRFYRSYTNGKVYYTLKDFHRTDVYWSDTDPHTRLIDPLPTYVDPPYGSPDDLGRFRFKKGVSYRSRKNGLLYAAHTQDVQADDASEIRHGSAYSLPNVDPNDPFLADVPTASPDPRALYSVQGAHYYSEFKAGKTYRSRSNGLLYDVHQTKTITCTQGYDFNTTVERGTGRTVVAGTKKKGPCKPDVAKMSGNGATPLPPPPDNTMIHPPSTAAVAEYTVHGCPKSWRGPNGEKCTDAEGRQIPGQYYRLRFEEARHSAKYARGETLRKSACYLALPSNDGAVPKNCPANVCLENMRNSLDVYNGASKEWRALSEAQQSTARAVAEKHLMPVPCPEDSAGSTCASFCKAQGGFCLSRCETGETGALSWENVATDCKSRLASDEKCACAFLEGPGTLEAEPTTGYWTSMRPDLRCRCARRDRGDISEAETTERNDGKPYDGPNAGGVGRTGMQGRQYVGPSGSTWGSMYQVGRHYESTIPGEQGVYTPVRSFEAQDVAQGLDKGLVTKSEPGTWRRANILSRKEGGWFNGLSDLSLREWAADVARLGATHQAGVACAQAASAVPKQETLPALSEWHWQTARCAQDGPQKAFHWAVGGEFRFPNAGGVNPCACARYFQYTHASLQATDPGASLSGPNGTKDCGPTDQFDITDAGAPMCSNASIRGYSEARYLRRLQKPLKGDDAGQMTDGIGTRFTNWTHAWVNDVQRRDVLQAIGGGAGKYTSSYFCCSGHARPTATTGVSDKDRDMLHARDSICRRFFGPLLRPNSVYAAKQDTPLPEGPGWQAVPVPSVGGAEAARHTGFQCHVRIDADSGASAAALFDRDGSGTATARGLARPAPSVDSGPPLAFELRLVPTAAQRRRYGEEGGEPSQIRVCSVRVGPAVHEGDALAYLDELEPTGTTGSFDRLRIRKVTDLPEAVQRQWGLVGGGSGILVAISVDYTYGNKCLGESQGVGRLITRDSAGEGIPPPPVSATDKTDRYDEYRDAIGRAYLAESTGLSAYERHNLGLYQRLGVLRAHGSNWGMAKSASRGEAIGEAHYAGDSKDARRMCASGSRLTDPAAIQNASRRDKLSSFHMQFGMARRLVTDSWYTAMAPAVGSNAIGIVAQGGRTISTGKQQAQASPRTAQQMYRVWPRTAAYDHAASNPVADVAFAFKTWGFHETTPCRPGGDNGPPSKCARGTGDARGEARLQYNEFGNQTNAAGVAPRNVGCMLYNGCSATAEFGSPGGADYAVYYRGKHKLSSTWASDPRGGAPPRNTTPESPCEDQVGAERVCFDGARQGTIDCGDRSTGGWGTRCKRSCGHCPTPTWPGKSVIVTLIETEKADLGGVTAEQGLASTTDGQYEMYSTRRTGFNQEWDANSRPTYGREWRTFDARSAGMYYSAPFRDRQSHRFCGLTIGPKAHWKDRGGVVVDGGGRQFDAAACYRFDTCHAPVVFSERVFPSADSEATMDLRHLSLQKSSLVPTCGAKAHVPSKLTEPTNVSAFDDWTTHAADAADRAAPYMQMIVRETDVAVRAANIFGGGPGRDELLLPARLPPCGESISFRNRSKTAFDSIGQVAGGGFRCDSGWMEDVAAGVADAPAGITRFGTAVRAMDRGSIDDEVNACATTGARYQVPGYREGEWGAQTRTTDAEPVLTHMPACAATLRDLLDGDGDDGDDGAVDLALRDQAIALRAANPHANRLGREDLGAGALGWEGYGTWRWTDERISDGLARASHTYRGAYYDFPASTARLLAGEGDIVAGDKKRSEGLTAFLRFSYSNDELRSTKTSKLDNQNTPLRLQDDPEARLVLANGGWLGSAIYHRHSDDSKAAYWLRARALGRYYSTTGLAAASNRLADDQHPQTTNVRQSDTTVESAYLDSSVRTGQEPNPRLDRLKADGGVQDPGVKSGAALPFYDGTSRSTVWYQDAPSLPSAETVDSAWLAVEGIPSGTLGGGGWFRSEDVSGDSRVLDFARLCRRSPPRMKWIVDIPASCGNVRVIRGQPTAAHEWGQRVVVTADGLRFAAAGDQTNDGGGGCGCAVLGGDGSQMMHNLQFGDRVHPDRLGTACPPLAHESTSFLEPLADPQRVLAAGNTRWMFPTTELPAWTKGLQPTEGGTLTSCAATGHATEAGGYAAFAYSGGRCYTRPMKAADRTAWGGVFPPPHAADDVAVVWVGIGRHSGAEGGAFVDFTRDNRHLQVSAAIAGSEGAGDGGTPFYGDPAKAPTRLFETYAVTRRDNPQQTAYAVAVGDRFPDAGGGGRLTLYEMKVPPGYEQPATESEAAADATADTPYDLVRAATTCSLVSQCAGIRQTAAGYTLVTDATKPMTFVRQQGGSPTSATSRVFDARDLAPMLEPSMTFEQRLATSRAAIAKGARLQQPGSSAAAAMWPRLYRRQAYDLRVPLCAYLDHDPSVLAGTPLDLLRFGGPDKTLQAQVQRRVVEAAATELDRLATTHAALTADAISADTVVQEGTMVPDVAGSTCDATCAKLSTTTKGIWNRGVCLQPSDLAPEARPPGHERLWNQRRCDTAPAAGAPASNCLCATDAPLSGVNAFMSRWAVGRSCKSGNGCAGGACGRDGRCVRRTRMHATTVRAGYRGRVGTGVPYAFAREAAGMHRIYGSSSKRIARPSNVAYHSGPGPHHESIDLVVRRWREDGGPPRQSWAEYRAIPGQKTSGQVWLVVSPPFAPAVYAEPIAATSTRADLAAATTALEERLRRVRFCAAEGGRCGAGKGVQIRFGTVAQLLSGPTPRVQVSEEADANWEFSTRCVCAATGQTTLVGMPKTAEWSMAVTDAGFDAEGNFALRDDLTMTHHVDVTYGNRGMKDADGRPIAARVLEMRSNREQGRGHWLSTGKVYEAFARTTRKPTDQVASQEQRLAHGKTAMTTEIDMPLPTESPFCAGGASYGLHRTPVNDKSTFHSLVPPSADKAGGELRIGVGAQCIDRKDVPTTYAKDDEAGVINCEPAKFPGAKQRAVGVGPTRFCAVEADLDERSPAGPPSVVDALMSIVQGRSVVSVETALSVASVTLHEAPPHSFNQAYLRQVWRHHAWRHGTGAMGAAADSNFHTESRETAGQDPGVDGNRDAVMSMYQRLPKTFVTPQPYSDDCESNNVAMPSTGLSDFDRMYRGSTDDPHARSFTCKAMYPQRPTQLDLGEEFAVGDQVQIRAGAVRGEVTAVHGEPGTTNAGRTGVKLTVHCETQDNWYGSHSEVLRLVRTTATTMTAAGRKRWATLAALRAGAGDTWAELGCGRSQFTSEETNRLRVPGFGSNLHVKLDAPGHPGATFKENKHLWRTHMKPVYDVTQSWYRDARAALTMARPGGEDALVGYHSRDHYTLDSTKTFAQGYGLREATLADRKGFEGTATASGHRTGRFELYNETEAQLQTLSVLAPHGGGVVRPPLEHFNPMEHRDAAEWAKSTAVPLDRMRRCCLGGYDDAQQAAWGVTTMKPVNNALHAGWGTMGTFVMPQNARANFYCTAEHNAAMSSEANDSDVGGSCTGYLHDLCYTPDSHEDCAPFGTDLQGDPERTPARCVGYWDEDVAVRTACRAHTRSKHNWVRSSDAMQAYCTYQDQPKRTAEAEARRRPGDDWDDPRRMQCAHWCAWFCRLDTPGYKITRWRNGADGYTQSSADRFMCNPKADAGSEHGKMQAAGGWCEDYMLGREEGGGRSATLLAARDGSFDRKALTDPTQYGFCAADYATNDRNLHVCGCFWAGLKGAHATSNSMPFCDEDGTCSRHGFLLASQKGQQCPPCYSQADVNTGKIDIEGDDNEVTLIAIADACSTNAQGEQEPCADPHTGYWLETQRRALGTCEERLAGDTEAVLSAKPSCKAVLSADDADDQWVAGVLYGTDGDKHSAYSDTSAGGMALSTEPAAESDDMLCFRHEGVYRCTRNHRLQRAPTTTTDVLLLGTRLRGDKDETTAHRSIPVGGAAGIAQCAKMCTYDAVFGIGKSSFLPEDVAVDEDSLSQYTNFKRVGRCIGFRVDLSSLTCTPYGIERDQSAVDASGADGTTSSSTTSQSNSTAPRWGDIGGSTIGKGQGQCLLGCDEATTCASKRSVRLGAGTATRRGSPSSTAVEPITETPAAPAAPPDPPDDGDDAPSFLIEKFLVPIVAGVLALFVLLYMRSRKTDPKKGNKE